MWNTDDTDKDHIGTQTIFWGLFEWGGGLGWGGALTFTRTSNYLLAMGWGVGWGGAITFTRASNYLLADMGWGVHPFWDTPMPGNPHLPLRKPTVCYGKSLV